MVKEIEGKEHNAVPGLGDDGARRGQVIRHLVEDDRGNAIGLRHVIGDADDRVDIGLL